MRRLKSKNYIKTFFKIFIISICIISEENILYGSNYEIPDSTRILLNTLIPTNYAINILVEGKLNQDTLNDIVLFARHPEIPDSFILMVFFQKKPFQFEKVLESSSLVSQYDNYIWISNDNVLNIKTVEPWNGVNSHTDAIKYISDHWCYVKSSSDASDPENSWSNSVNFITGEYKIRHEVNGKDKKSHLKEIKGFIEKKGPIPLNEDCSKYMKTNFNSQLLHIYGRCNLWSDKEIEELLK